MRRRDEPPLLPLGDDLGELKNELPPGSEMRILTAAGPKHYSYKLKEVATEELDHVIKIRCITLNNGTWEEITFNDMYNVAR